MVFLHCTEKPPAILAMGMGNKAAIVAVAILCVGMKTVLIAILIMGMLIRNSARTISLPMRMLVLFAGGVDNVTA